MTLSTELLVMFRVILIAIISLSFTEIFGIPQVPADVTPITGFHQGPTRGQQKGQQLFNVAPQTSDRVATLPNAHRKPTIAAETSSQSDVLYGLPPPDGQSLKNSFYLQNSDKSNNYNFVRETSNSNQFRSPQDPSNEELIASYVPPVVSRQNTNDQGSGAEYADYAPHYKAKYTTGIMKGLSSYQGQTSSVNSPTYQTQSKNIEYNTDSYQHTKIQNLRNDTNNRNNQKVPNQEVTVESTPDFKGRLYQNYRYSQDVHRSEPEIQFHNPSYPNPKYEFAGEVPDVQPSQNDTTFQNPSYPNPKFDVSAIESDIHRSRAETKLENPSYPNPKYELPGVISDVHRAQSDTTFQNPSYPNPKYEFPGEAPDVQRSQPDTVFQNPSYPNRKYDVSAIESDIHRSPSKTSFQDAVTDFERSHIETKLENPSYPNLKYELPGLISDVQRSQPGTVFQNPSYQNPKYDVSVIESDIHRSQTGTKLENPSYPNPKYELPGVISDVQRAQSDTIFQNPSYPNPKYEFSGEAPDVQRSQPGTVFQNPSYQNPKYDVSAIESDIHRSQTETKLENPSYPNDKYELPGVISGVQRTQTDTAFQSPSHPNLKYEFPGEAPDVQHSQPGTVYQNPKYDVSAIESDIHRSQTGTKLENPSYPNAKYELSGVISGVQRAQTDTTFQSPSHPNLKYEFPGEALAFPGVVSQNERTVAPAQQSSITKYESPVFQHFGASSYRSSDGHNNLNYHSKSQEEGKALAPAVVSSDYRESTYDLPVRTSSGANKPTDQTQKYYSAPYQRQANPNLIYETPAPARSQARYRGTAANPESGVEGHSYVVQSYQRPTIRYEAPVRYIAVFQKHRTPGRADISTESYLTQAIHDKQQTQSGQTLPGSNQNTDVPIVLPISSYYQSPTGSISSTFISKDVAGYQLQPAYVQRIFRGQTRPAASAHRDISNTSPQSTYGLPNF